MDTFTPSNLSPQDAPRFRNLKVAMIIVLAVLVLAAVLFFVFQKTIFEKSPVSGPTAKQQQNQQEPQREYTPAEYEKFRQEGMPIENVPKQVLDPGAFQAPDMTVPATAPDATSNTSSEK